MTSALAPAALRWRLMRRQTNLKQCVCHAKTAALRILEALTPSRASRGQ